MRGIVFKLLNPDTEEHIGCFNNEEQAIKWAKKNLTQDYVGEKDEYDWRCSCGNRYIKEMEEECDDSFY